MREGEKDRGERERKRESLPGCFLWEREIPSVCAGMLDRPHFLNGQYFSTGHKYLESDTVFHAIFSAFQQIAYKKMTMSRVGQYINIVI